MSRDDRNPTFWQLPLLVVLGACLPGCIYLTEPTGLRLGDHSNEFAKPVRFLSYETKDFAFSYPEIWGIGKGIEQVLPDGRTIRRVSVGMEDATGNPLGVLINEYNIALPLDPKESLNGLSAQVRNDLLLSIPKAEQIGDTELVLGGVPARSLEFVGQSGGSGTRLAAMGVCARHNATSLGIIFIGELKAVQAYLPYFNVLLARFEWRPPVTPTPSSGPTPTP